MEYAPRNIEFPLDKKNILLAEVAIALYYVHSQNIIFRDLKKENIMIGEDGHIRLIDFGMAIRSSVANTQCGTSYYMAPEMILRKDYTNKVDWWSFGVLAYFILVNKLPFEGETKDETFKQILDSEPTFPIDFPEDQLDFIENLLKKDPHQRMNFQGIITSSFMRGISFSQIGRRKISLY